MAKKANLKKAPKAPNLVCFCKSTLSFVCHKIRSIFSILLTASWSPWHVTTNMASVAPSYLPRWMPRRSKHSRPNP